MSNVRQALRTAAEVVQSEEFAQLRGTARELMAARNNENVAQFQVNARDFLSARDEESSAAGTDITQANASLIEAAEILDRGRERTTRGGVVNKVIAPVVLPKDHRSYWWLLLVAGLVLFGLAFGGLLGGIDLLGGLAAVDLNLAWIFFGPHYWLLVAGYAAFSLVKNSYVMIPDGCKALITKFGKVEETVEAGGKWIFHPRKRVSYIVNTTKEYPYNAPIRKAPTQGRVEASVDLFLQFRIEDPGEFIFTLGGVNGFSEKLDSIVSEVTRALIYDQQAADIYDLVGESTQGMLQTLNEQFLPAVRFVSANITHAEPASRDYRMDLAAPEIVRVAKEAYTYQYELNLRKEQDEGDLNKELASLRQKLSEIDAEIATYQAQIDVAQEKAENQANAYAGRLLVEARSGAQANAALLEAQALDIRAINMANYPEILEFRYRQAILDRLEMIADKLPQVVNIGPAAGNGVDFMAVARQMLGLSDESLYTSDEMSLIRERLDEIAGRIKKRSARIENMKQDFGAEAALTAGDLSTEVM